MIGKLTLYYNRTRQSVITRELIEIISGAAALDVKEQDTIIMNFSSVKNQPTK